MSIVTQKDIIHKHAQKMHDLVFIYWDDIPFKTISVGVTGNAPASSGEDVGSSPTQRSKTIYDTRGSREG